MQPAFLIPDWPVPSVIQARVSLRSGGLSRGNFSGFNLATHVGDDEAVVAANRKLLAEQLGLEVDALVWGRQVHGVDVLELPLPASNNCTKSDASVADAFYTSTVNQPCLVMTADCLPVFFAAADGSEVAVAHAGWRGLAAGVLEQTLKRFSCAPSEILVYLGPAIGPQAFQVGKDVYRTFSHLAGFEQAFVGDGEKPGFYRADIYRLAKLALGAAGIAQASIYGGEFCTFNQSEEFFSYRRDAIAGADGVRDTGRMASLIWIQS